MKQIIIVDCGPTLEDVSKQYGHSPEWIMSCLGNMNCKFKWIKKYTGQKMKNIYGDAWIITGSPQSVYEEVDWMLDLENDIRRASDVNLPILGICFGHQIIAKSFGGSVKLNPNGWELGSYPIYLTEDGLYSPLFRNIDKQTIVYQSHRDCVVELPKQAMQLAYNQKCTQAFQIFDSIYSVQFHPEFSWNVMKKYVSVRTSSGVIVEDPSIPKSTQGHLVLQNFINLI